MVCNRTILNHFTKLLFGLIQIRKLPFVFFAAISFSITTIIVAQRPTSKSGDAAVNFNYSLGKEVLVSNNPDGGALRCEPSAAIFKDTVIVAWNDSYGGKSGASKNKVGISVAWAMSLDRGRTFKFGGYLPVEKTGVLSGADSWLAADREGNFYLQVLSLEGPYEIQVYYMDRRDPGRWQRMSNAATAEALDKPSMSVDSDGRIGIAYNSGNSDIYFALSKDKGKSWAAPVRISDSSIAARLGTSVALSKTRIVVSWAQGSGIYLKEIWWTESVDGGKTFSSPALLFKSKDLLESPKGYVMGLGYPFSIVSNPWLTRTNDSGNATFYLTYAEGVGKGSRILLFTLSPDGKKWSPPVAVGDTPDQAIKIMPSVAAAGGSRPIILYYDRRNNSGGSLTDVYLSILREGAAKFEDIKLNSVSTDWTKTPGDKQYAPIQRNFGDYITLASHNNVFIAAWTDGRDGVSRIYARTIEIK